jgi:undecaprenyl diphosphate synthase
MVTMAVRIISIESYLNVTASWHAAAASAASAGHRAGVKAVRVTVETCARLGLKALTLYAFSVENR